MPSLHLDVAVFRQFFCTLPQSCLYLYTRGRTVLMSWNFPALALHQDQPASSAPQSHDFAELPYLQYNYSRQITRYCKAGVHSTMQLFIDPWLYIQMHLFKMT